MGEPRPRHTHPVIIDKPELKTPARRMMEGSITAILWAIWMYWILPVVTVVLWTIGFRMFYSALFSAEQFKELHLILKNGGLALLVIFLFNLLWINYNYHFIYRKFGARRKVSRHSDDRQLAALFHIDEKKLAEAKRHNHFKITLLDKTMIITSATSL